MSVLNKNCWRAERLQNLEKKSKELRLLYRYQLPEDDESREKVFDQLQIEDLKSKNGLTILIGFLFKHLAKDDLTDSLEKIEDFFSRSEGQSTNEYVAVFDAKYRKIEKKSMTLPAEILAFKLLRRADISKEVRLLVLTGMNYDEKATLYEQAKKSLKKLRVIT